MVSAIIKAFNIVPIPGFCFRGIHNSKTNILITKVEKPRMGTILNAFIIALTIEFSVFYLPYPQTYLLQLLQVVIGVLIIGLGSGFYLICNLGAGPRDGLMIGLQKVTNMRIYSIRTIIEISVVVIGSICLLNNIDKLLGEVVGLGTMIFALGIGPSVALGISLVGRLSKQT